MSEETDALSDTGVMEEVCGYPGGHCPNCSGHFVIKTRRRDGHRFLGCSNWPRCHMSYELTDQYDDES